MCSQNVNNTLTFSTPLSGIHRATKGAPLRRTPEPYSNADPKKEWPVFEERNWNAMKIGFTELILVVIVAFVVIGPDKLPEYARKLGKMLRELKKYTGAASEEIQKNVVEPLNEIQAPLKEAVAPLTDIKKDIDNSMKDVTKSFTGIGKTSKEEAAKKQNANNSRSYNQSLRLGRILK